jgi:oligopeptide transport system ATP-binding protein
LAEAFQVHGVASGRAAHQRAVDLLSAVGIPDAEERSRDYPHQFSGGMRQRVMIAMAVALDPLLLIADEPTTALDVTVQAQIMELLDQLQQERNMSIVLITHDLGVVAEAADRVAVMYAGRVVESGTVKDVLTTPRHPYTQALLASIPDPSEATLTPIVGSPPDMANLPSGCPFRPRCPLADERCITEVPVSQHVGPNEHCSACHHSEQLLQAEVEGHV